MTLRKIVYVLCLFGLLCGGDAWAGIPTLQKQQAPPLNVRVVDRGGGMPNDYINHLFKDQAGLMWVCSNRGVYFILPWGDIKNFGQGEGLVHQMVLQMAQTQDGWEYLATAEGGLLSFNGTRFAPVLPEVFGRGTIRYMAADQHNNLFIIIDGKLGYLNGKKQWQVLKTLNAGVESRIYTMPAGHVVLAEGHVVQPLMTMGGTVKATTAEALPLPAHAVAVAQAQGQLVFTDNEKVYLYAQGQNHWTLTQTLPSLGRNLISASISRDGKIWLGYRDKGLVVLDKEAYYEYNNKNYLSSNYIKQIFIDNEGAVWLGTYGNGFMHVSETYLSIYRKADGLDEQSVQHVAVSTDGRLTLATTSSSLFLIEKNKVLAVRDTSLYNLRTLAFSSATDAYMASDMGVYKVSFGAGGMHTTQRLPIKGGARALTCVVQGTNVQTNVQIWVATLQSKLVVLENNLVKETYDLPADFRIERLSQSGNRVWALSDDGQARAYSTEGLVLRQLSRTQGLPNTNINDIHDDGAGNVILATDSGIYTLPKGATRAKPAVKNGTAPVYLLFEHRGMLHALAEKLLYQKRDTGWLRCNSYKPMSNERAAVNTAVWSPNASMLALASTKGVAISNLNHWHTYTGAFKLVSLSGAADGFGSFDWTTTKTMLRYHEGVSSIRIRYQITDYNCNGDVRFYYQLVKDKDTSYFSTGNKDYNFIKPEPGHYKVSIYGIGQDGTLTSNKLYLDFVILPAWYKQGWFAFLVAVVLLATVWLSANLYSNYLYRQKMREIQMTQRIQAERERISRDLHDNVGSQLVYMVNALEQVRRQVPQMADEQVQEKNQNKLVELSTLARTTIQNLRESIWVLHQGGEIEMLNFVERIRRYLDQVKLLAHVRVHEHVSVEEGGHLTPVQALNLFRIVQEAVTNAVRHSQALEFHLSISWQQGLFSIEVADAGIGFGTGQNARSDSYGLKNMQHRAEEIGATFNLISTPGAGTRVVLTLPITPA